MANILAVDDEEGILEIIKNALEREGHVVTKISNPDNLKDNQFRQFELIILDIMMPGIDGITLCKRIRTLVDCPILFLTAKTMEEDIIEGLRVGADDYITKPFRIGELRARVDAHLRREYREKQNAFSVSECRFDMTAKEMYFKNKPLNFTKSEYDICEYLALNHGQVFSKDQILEKIYGFDSDSDTSAIVEHIKNIRNKLSCVGLSPIETVWGVGYKWKG